jgi:hypothetical protein
MNPGYFDTMPIGVILLFITIFMLGFCEAGYQVGAHFRKKQDHEATVSLGPLLGGLLGMLAFVLAITFSITASQHNLRKENVILEANAIGTAYLRADLLDEPTASEVKELLREYVDIRLQAASGGDLPTILARSAEIHQLLWSKVVSVSRTDPSVNTSLFAQSVNHVIDMNEIRVNAGLYGRIPTVIWLALFAITALSMITIGTLVGLTGKRRLVVIFPMLLAFAVLVSLIADLNRPQQGMIKVGQHAMLSLQKNMDQDVNQF